MEVAEAVSATKLQKRVGATMQVLVDSAPGMGKKGGVGRSYADAPEIDGVVQLLPPEKLSKQLKVGELQRYSSEVELATIEHTIYNRCV